MTQPTASREFFLNGIYTYAEADGARSADVFLANVQYNRLLGERAFVSFGAGVLRDEIADVSYRFTPKVNLGYYLIKEDTMTLSFEVGPGYTFEEVGDVTDSYFTIVAAEKFVWKIGERMTFKQSVAANVSTSDSENYILLADALLDTDITENLAWRVAVNWTYDNAPAAARDKDDVTLSTGMAVKF
jgi:putative salt-induced outer membrane protein